MKIAGIQKVSLIDYPGRMAATVFVAGCNLRCDYCYNRWMLDEAVVDAVTTPESFLAWLDTRKGLLDGVCISGGEATIQSELADLVRAVRGLGFAVKLDTNGTLPARLAALLGAGLLDYVAMDIKAPLDARYSEVAGRPVDLVAIRASMALLRARAPAFEFRTTVSPRLDERALCDIASEIQPEDCWYLQPFVVAPGLDPALTHAPHLDESALKEIVARLAATTPSARLRGTDL